MSRLGRLRIGPRLATAAVLLAVGTGLAAFGVITSPTKQRHPTGPGTEPLRVMVAPAMRSVSYSVAEEHIGRVVAKRESEVGFELGGMMREILVDEGDRVDAGAPIAYLDTKRLESRRNALAAARAQAEAEMELAGLIRDRLREARDLDAASSQDWDEADKTYKARAAAYARAVAEIETIDVDLAKSEIRAPFDAVVARRFVDEGRVIEAGVPIVRLLERTEPEVRLGVGSNLVDAIKERARFVVRIRGREVAGRVRAILPTRHPATRSVEVAITLETELDGIRRGDLARARIAKTVHRPGFWLPTQALTEGPRGSWSVYVAHAAEHSKHLLRTHAVEVVHSEENRVYVGGTLSEGDLVVQRGLHRLAPGMTVLTVREGDL